MLSRLFAKKTLVRNPVDSTRQIIKELEEIIIRLQTSINSLKIGFVIVDTNVDVVNINDAARFLLCNQYGKHDVFNHICTISELNEKISLTIHLNDEIKKCLSTRTAIFIKDVELKDRYLSLRLYPVLLGGSKEPSKNVLTGVSIIIEDTTQEKIALRSRDEFLSIASHELRTPLTAIRGNASLVKEYFPEILSSNKELKEMIEDIEESSVNLIRIVNEFLNVSRLEQGKLVFNHELINIIFVINMVVNGLKINAQEKNLQVVIENLQTPSDSLYIIADEVRVREVLSNLIENAIKYTEKGSVKVQITTNSDKAVIRVADTGRGIPIHNQAMLFQKFQQAGKSIYTRDSSSGTGLGLYISRLLVERMGGSLYLEHSEENTGSVFVFTVPLASALEIKMLRARKPYNEVNMVRSGV